MSAQGLFDALEITLDGVGAELHGMGDGFGFGLEGGVDPEEEGFEFAPTEELAEVEEAKGGEPAFAEPGEEALLGGGFFALL